MVSRGREAGNENVGYAPVIRLRVGRRLIDVAVRFHVDANLSAWLTSWPVCGLTPPIPGIRVAQSSDANVLRARRSPHFPEHAGPRMAGTTRRELRDLPDSDHVSWARTAGLGD